MAPTPDAPGNRALVELQARQQFFRNSGLAARRTEAIAQGLHVVEILAEDYATRHIQRVTDAIRFHQWIAIAVSADPRAKLHEVRKRGFVEIESVGVAKRFHHFGINLRKRLEQREAEVAQAHADFIVDGRLRRARN